MKIECCYSWRFWPYLRKADGRRSHVEQFMKEKGRGLAVRISQHGLSLHDGILSVPFYMCSEIPRLLDEAEHF